MLHINSQYSANSSNPSSSERFVNKPDGKNPVPQTIAKASNDQTNSSHLVHSSQIQTNFSSNNDEPILLRTALVQIHLRGDLFPTRALIDPGSQRTFVSEKLRNLLKLPFRKSQFEIIGIGGKKQTASKECEITIVSTRQNFTFSINAIVLPKVTRNIPAYSFIISNPEELNELDLADPHFNQSSQIDLILGNDSERFINLDGIKKNICGETSAYNTIFGWVLSGPIKA